MDKGFDISEMLKEPPIGDERRVEDTQPVQQEDVVAQPFFNEGHCEPQYVLQKERPEHRAICFLVAQGYTTTEIADQTGWTTVTINYVKKQPWAQKFIAEQMERAGRKIVMSELQGAAREAAQTLIKTMRGTYDGTKVADMAKAANSILDRCYGTAPQVVMHSQIDPSNLSDEELAATVSTGNTQ